MYIEFSLSLISSLITYYLINKKNWCSVRASAVVTLLLSLLVLRLPNVENLQLLIFGASFIGMSLSQRFNYLDIIFASIIFSLSYHYFIQNTPPVGGVLGFCAFISLLIISLFKKIHKKLV